MVTVLMAVLEALTGAVQLWDPHIAAPWALQ